MTISSKVCIESTAESHPHSTTSALIISGSHKRQINGLRAIQPPTHRLPDHSASVSAHGTIYTSIIIYCLSPQLLPGHPLFTKLTPSSSFKDDGDNDTVRCRWWLFSCWHSVSQTSTDLLHAIPPGRTVNLWIMKYFCTFHGGLWIPHHNTKVSTITLSPCFSAG